MALAYMRVVPSAIKPPLRPLAAAAILRASSTRVWTPARASQSAAAAPVMPAPITAMSVSCTSCNGSRLAYDEFEARKSACQKDVLLKIGILVCEPDAHEGHPYISRCPLAPARHLEG